MNARTPFKVIAATPEVNDLWRRTRSANHPVGNIHKCLNSFRIYLKFKWQRRAKIMSGKSVMERCPKSYRQFTPHLED